jgi:hypothetical protein
VREAFAFILFLVVVALGWKQPYSKHYYSLIGKPAPKARQAFAATPSPAERLAQIEAKYGAPGSDAGGDRAFKGSLLDVREDENGFRLQSQWSLTSLKSSSTAVSSRA